MRKRIKEILTMASLAFVLFGCGEQNPAEPVENILKHLQNNELSEVGQYLYVDSGEETETGQQEFGNYEESESYSDAIIQAMTACAEENASYIRYEILDSKVDNDDAIVKVKITYKNAGPVAKLAVNELINQSISNALTSAFTGGGDMDDEDMAAVFLASFEKAKENAVIIDKTDTLEIHCKKIDKEWKICDYDVFLNIYYCNIFDSISSMFDEEDSDAETVQKTENVDVSVETESEPENSDVSVEAESESDPDIMYYKDNDMKETLLSFTTWDDDGEMKLDLTYVGEDGAGQYVGEFEMCISSYYEDEEPKSLTITGKFTEDGDGNGTLFFDSGNTSDYDMYWNEDHYVLSLKFNGETWELLEADWAYSNVG